MYSKGYRRRTRKLFKKDFGTKGNPKPSKILQKFKVGDLVDCFVDPSVVKGMPHKYYHGKTGKVYDVNKRAVGVIFYRRVKGKKLLRQVNCRIEHLRISKSNAEVKRIRQKINDCKEKGVAYEKRAPVGPRKTFSISTAEKQIIEVEIPAYVSTRQ